MAERSSWSAQAFQYHGDDSCPIRVMYFRKREEVFEALKDVTQSTRDISVYPDVSKSSEQKFVNPSFKLDDFLHGDLFKPMEEAVEVSQDFKFPSLDDIYVPKKMKGEGRREEGREKEEKKKEKISKPKKEHLNGIGSSWILGSTRHKQKHEDNLELKTKSLIGKLYDFFPKGNAKVQPIEIPGYTNPPTGHINRDYWKHLMVEDPYGHMYPNKNYKYALIFGISHELNPGGTWIVEDLFNDLEEFEDSENSEDMEDLVDLEY